MLGGGAGVGFRSVRRRRRSETAGRANDEPEVARTVEGASVPVAVVGSRAEAHVIVGLLNRCGSGASVVPDDVGEQEPQLQLQGVQVLVAPGDVASARRLPAVEGAEGADAT